MAVTAPHLTSAFPSIYLTPELSEPIFQEAAEASVVQRLARRIPLGATGVAVPVITGDIDASWVNEGAAKPVNDPHDISILTMAPKKIATIVAVSREVARLNPEGFLGEARSRIATAFARAFDNASLHGINTPFASYLDQTTKVVEMGSNTVANGGIYKDMVDALDALVQDSKMLDGWALDTVVEPIFLGAVDLNGRPLFNETPYTGAVPALRSGTIIGRNAVMSKVVATADKQTVVGYGGDWSKVVWGAVGGIEFTVTDMAAATINGQLVSAFENNLVFLRAEAEYGFLCADVEHFVKLSNLL